MGPPPNPPPGLRNRRRKLGELLLEAGHLTWPQLEAAITLQRQWGTPLGRVVVARGYCTDEALLAALSRQLGLQPVDLDAVQVDQRAAELLKVADAERLRAVPFALAGNRNEELQVAFAAPAALDVQDQVLVLAGKARIRAFLTGDEALARAIGRVYRNERSHVPRSRATPTPAAEPVPGLDLGAGLAAPEAPTTDPAAVAAQAPPAAPVPSAALAAEPEPSNAIGALQLSEGCVAVIRQAAADNQVTPREVMRRVLEAWAEPYRGKGR